MDADEICLAVGILNSGGEEDTGDHFVVNGQKRYILGAEGAGLFLVYAKTDPAAKPQKHTCLIIDWGSGVDRQTDFKTVRRMVSESKKFVTEACQKVAPNAMQVMGGIGYTNGYPIK